MALSYGYGVRSVEAVSKAEKERAKNFQLIKEYKTYYLYGRYTQDGKLLYRECFSKFDIDGVNPQKRPRKVYLSWKW